MCLRRWKKNVVRKVECPNIWCPWQLNARESRILIHKDFLGMLYVLIRPPKPQDVQVGKHNWWHDKCQSRNYTCSVASPGGNAWINKHIVLLLNGVRTLITPIHSWTICSPKFHFLNYWKVSFAFACHLLEEINFNAFNFSQRINSLKIVLLSAFAI